MASSGNFCTFNPLPYSTNFRTGLSNVYNGVTGAGNTQSNPGNNCTGFGTMALTSGKKWYMDQKYLEPSKRKILLERANRQKRELWEFLDFNTSFSFAIVYLE